ncbi:MAG: HD domain-containing protein [Anaerolineaceae bacterium]|nr:HD domain-containing protein [Anaerolineaceae bacterium]
MPTITINTTQLQSLLAYASVVQARDSNTYGHMWRVSQYAGRLAEKAGFSPGEVFIAGLGGLVHDVGKIGIPDRILQKPGRLGSEEMALVKEHPRMGYLLIQHHPLSTIVNGVILEHHERIDGSGYPYRRSGDQISIYARVIAIADAFDAMTSPRSYRAVKSIIQACNTLRREKGRQFDPFLANVFIRMALQGEFESIIGHSLTGQRLVSCLECGPVIGSCTPSTRSGIVVCPECGKRYRLHPNGNGFELEWLGEHGQAEIQLETDAMREFIHSAPNHIHI